MCAGRGANGARIVRGFLAAIAATLVSPVGGCGDDPAPEASSGGRPNVLIVVMDTTRADHCSTDGYDRATTPNLERLASSGVNFRDAWVPAGWTAPSHASLFTGLRPAQHGLLDARRLILRSKFTTLAEHLQAAGWATGCFSNNDVISEQFGLTQGFETIAPFYLYSGIAHPNARATHDRVLEFARDSHETGRPFFAFVNDLEPHLPYEPPDAFEQFRAGRKPDAATIAAARKFNNPVTLRCNIGEMTVPPDVAAILPDLYDGEIAHLDSEVGRLIGGLEKLGLLSSTLVVVTSDHGENLGDHGFWGHRFSLHRCIRRVPLVMRLPGVFDGGREVRDPVRIEDVMPSVLEACGLAVPTGLDGKSLLHDLPGRISRATWSPQRWPRPALQGKYPQADSPLFDRAIRAVYDGRYHLMEIDDDVVELYDVPADPDETNDLAASLPDVVRRLRDLLDP